MVQLGNQKIVSKTVAAYVIVALLFQIYLLAVTVLNPSQVNVSSGHAITEKVLLCTPQGFKWVEITQLMDINADSDESATQHDQLNFHCPLLEACHFFLILVAACLLAFVLWLSRSRVAYTYYCHIVCYQKVYLSLAPKQSPPNIIFA